MIPTLPPEFRLMAACCMWPASEARNAAIRECASPAIDWDGFLQTVRWQRVAALVNDGLISAGIPVPPAVAVELRADAKIVACQSLAFALEALRLQALFDDAGVSCVFLKGTTLAQLAYGNIGIKQAWDIDLLVPANSLHEAGAVLGEAGYERVQPRADITGNQFAAWSKFGHEAIYRHHAHGAAVELHWRLAENPAQFQHVTAESATQAVEVLPECVLRTLKDEDLFAFLCVHGAQHVWTRIKWPADLAAWLATMTPDAVERLYRRAGAMGCGRAPDQALLLCEILFATKLSQPLSAALRRDWVTRRLVAIALKAMVRTGTTGKGVLSTSLDMHVSHFLLRRGTRHWLQELGLKFVSKNDVLLFSLPRPLYFLYPLIRIPSWLWRHGMQLARLPGQGANRRFAASMRKRTPSGGRPG